MDIAPRDIPADELQDTIRSVRSDLATAGETPFLRRDPYRLVLAGLGDVLGVFGKSITRWERAVADVIAARDPLPKADRDALKAELITAVEDGAFRGMRKEAQRMLRTFDRAQARNTGLAVGGAFVTGAALAFFAGWWVFAPISGLACGDQADGARMCWMYTKLPTKEQQAATNMPATKPPAPVVQPAKPIQQGKQQ